MKFAVKYHISTNKYAENGHDGLFRTVPAIVPFSRVNRLKLWQIPIFYGKTVKTI